MWFPQYSNFKFRDPGEEDFALQYLSRLSSVRFTATQKGQYLKQLRVIVPRLNLARSFGRISFCCGGKTGNAPALRESFTQDMLDG